MPYGVVAGGEGDAAYGVVGCVGWCGLVEVGHEVGELGGDGGAVGWGDVGGGVAVEPGGDGPGPGVAFAGLADADGCG